MNINPRHIFILTIGAVMASQMLTGCTIENIDNGDLDGFWHMESIDTIETGGRLDLSDEVLFWAFQAKLMHTQGSSNEFYFRFNHSGDSLMLYDAYLDHGHQDKEDGGDIVVEDPTLLKPYGIQTLTDTFTVEALSSSKMILSTAAHRIRFTKF